MRRATRIVFNLPLSNKSSPFIILFHSPNISLHHTYFVYCFSLRPLCSALLLIGAAHRQTCNSAILDTLRTLLPAVSLPVRYSGDSLLCLDLCFGLNSRLGEALF